MLIPAGADIELKNMNATLGTYELQTAGNLTLTDVESVTGSGETVIRVLQGGTLTFNGSADSTVQSGVIQNTSADKTVIAADTAIIEAKKQYITWNDEKLYFKAEKSSIDSAIGRQCCTDQYRSEESGRNGTFLLLIALDVLYVGESDDPEGDAYLAEACANSCPVVTACAGTFGSQVVEHKDGSFSVDEYALTAYDEPYDELKDATWQGHINSMFDSDGVLRHGIWQIDLPDGQQIPSFHRQIYELYCEQTGQKPKAVPVTDSRYRYYIPFQGEPGAYSDGYGVVDLLNGEIDPSAYAGKIVMIGPYAAGMQDDFATAIDHAGKMYGVEYQANMVDALLRGQTKREAGTASQLVAVILVSILWTLLFYRRKFALVFTGWLGTVAGYLGICMLAYAKGLVLSPLYIPLAVTLLFVSSIVSGYLRAAMEKRRVTATFKRYVAPEIVQILNRYLTLTSTCIFENNGTLDKFVGDCTMAFWGAPLPQEDSIYKAVKTAFAMIERSAALQKELEEKYGRTVSFGVGVHFSPAVVGNTGAPNRMDYTAIGDTVNTAARLEANAPGGCIYVSRAVADALEGCVRFTSLGDSVPLKGKAAGFEVLRAEELL